MGFEVERDFLFFTFVSQNCSNEKHEAIWGNTIVQFQPLLSACNCSKHRQTIDSRFDVWGRTKFLRQHRWYSGDLILLKRLIGSLMAVDRLRRTFGGIMRLIMEVPALQTSSFSLTISDLWWDVVTLLQNQDSWWAFSPSTFEYSALQRLVDSCWAMSNIVREKPDTRNRWGMNERREE